MFELTIICDFEAAHCLPEYPGKCARLHGHNWKVEVTVTGSKLDHLGMLVDFKELKQEVNRVLGQLDHYYLNQVPPFNTINPTAENLARYIYEEVSQAPFTAGAGDLHVAMVKVWESPHSAAAYREV